MILFVIANSNLRIGNRIELLAIQLEFLGIQTAQVAKIISQGPRSRKRATDRRQYDIDIRLQLLSLLRFVKAFSAENTVDLIQIVEKMNSASGFCKSTGGVIACHVVIESLVVWGLILRKKQEHDEPWID